MVLILFLILWSSPALAVTQWCDHASVETCWTIEAGSGIVWDDKSSNAVDADCDDGGTWSADVPDGDDGFDGTSTYSYDFSGDDSVDGNYDPDGDSRTANTFVLWVNIDTPTSLDRIFALNNTNGRGLLQYNSSGIKPDWYGNGFDLYASLDDIPTGEWEHYAATYDETADVARIYVNGVLKQSDTDITTQATDILVIGARVAGTSEIDGRMDEFAIFSVELTSTQINDIYENGLVQAAATGRTRRFF